MNKKTLRAFGLFSASLLTLAVGSAVQAADVKIGGIVDLGLNYNRLDNGSETTDTFQMASGQNAMSRWNIRGSEDLGNGMKASFFLDSGFQADSGEFNAATNNSLFGREASVALSGSFGEVKLGRVPAFLSGYNATGLFGPKVSPFSATWLNVPGHKIVMTGDFLPYDNVINYVTPDFAGFKAHFQYSFGTHQKKYSEAGLEEGSSDVDRMFAAAVSYEKPHLYLTAIFDTIAYANDPAGGKYGTTEKADDLKRFSVGGHYDFGSFKLMAAGQYFDGARSLSMAELNKTAKLVNAADGVTAAEGGIEGFGVNVGAIIPVAGGMVKLSTGYMDAQNAEDSEIDMKRYTVSAGYEYPLSKRTSCYAAVGYQKDSYGRQDVEDADSIGVASGIVYKF